MIIMCYEGNTLARLTVLAETVQSISCLQGLTAMRKV